LTNHEEAAEVPSNAGEFVGCQDFTMGDSDLDRFISPVTEHLDTVLEELEAGCKESHWMWFMFPQLRALGRSDTAKHFGLTDLDAACRFLRHEMLGPTFERLVAKVHDVIVDRHLGVHDVFDTPDDLKLVSSLTLFHAAATRTGHQVLAEHCTEVLDEAERQGFRRCAVTLRVLEAQRDLTE
jgi:uncharacterized protein (DUF1810 family)